MQDIITIVCENSGERIDAFIGNEIGDLSRSYVQKLIANGSVSLNGVCTTSKKIIIQEGDLIEIKMPPLEIIDVVPENIPLNIVYEDECLIVVNKPQGMVVHPAPGHYTGTLVNALMWSSDRLSSINGVIRPGIVHRIDKDTSGLLMVAKTDQAHESLAMQLKDKSSVRVYYAIVNGVLSDNNGSVNAPIGRHPNDRKKMAIIKNGKEAVTHYEVIERMRKHTLLKLRLETGRTHQIRVHMASIGHPLLGDPVYGLKNEKVKYTGQALHAKLLGFVHPVTLEKMVFDSELPQYFEELLEKCRRI